MAIDNNLLECDIFKSFMEEYDFPKELKIKIIVAGDMEDEYKKQLQRLNKKYDYHFSVSQYKKSPTTYYFQTQTYKILQRFLTDYCELYGKCDLLERKYENAITILEMLYFKSHISPSLYQYKNRKIGQKQLKELPVIICPICGIEFHPLYPNQKYCSQKCSHIEQQRTNRPDRETFKNKIRSTSFL